MPSTCACPARKRGTEAGSEGPSSLHQSFAPRSSYDATINFLLARSPHERIRQHPPPAWHSAAKPAASPSSQPVTPPAHHPASAAGNAARSSGRACPFRVAGQRRRSPANPAADRTPRAGRGRAFGCAARGAGPLDRKPSSGPGCRSRRSQHNCVAPGRVALARRDCCALRNGGAHDEPKASARYGFGSGKRGTRGHRTNRGNDDGHCNNQPRARRRLARASARTLPERPGTLAIAA